MNKKKPQKELILDLPFSRNASKNEQVPNFVDVEELFNDHIGNPEQFAPSDQYKKLTGRREQLNLKVTAEFKRQVKAAAFAQQLMIVEIIEAAWAAYVAAQKNT